MLDEWEIKNLLFEIFAAGFQAGYSGDIDICTAYNQWWDDFIRETISNG